MTADHPQDPVLSLLCVEDESESRDILCDVLSLRYPELRILVAENGEAGLTIFRKFQPEIVLTDINMPVTDGISMAAEIRSISPATEIIALTAHSNTGHLMQAIEIGISQYILKPLDFDLIFTVIDKAVEKIRLKKSLSRQNAIIRKLSLAMDQSPYIIMLTDPAGQVEYVNPRFSQKTGFDNDDVIGHPLLAQETALLPAGVTAELENVLQAGGQWHKEFENRKRNGERYWESISVSPIHGEQGAVTNFLVTREDITARISGLKQIEALNADLVQNAKELDLANKELETFNYTVAHDLRSPMVSIGSYCQLLLDLYTGHVEPKGRDYIRVIHREILRMNGLIEALLKFSSHSRKSISKKWTDLSSIVHQIREDLTLRDPHRAVTFDISEGVEGYGDPILLRVVLENLLGNAWKFSCHRQDARIQFGTANAEEELVYFVRDNGTGFDSQDAVKLFLPFQRLQSDNSVEGFGIGLATAGRIIQRHGGRIWAEGEAGRGAVFYFSL